MNHFINLDRLMVMFLIRLMLSASSLSLSPSTDPEFHPSLLCAKFLFTSTSSSSSSLYSRVLLLLFDSDSSSKGSRSVLLLLSARCLLSTKAFSASAFTLLIADSRTEERILEEGGP
ncbi:hypothetical protein O6H91_19G059200 [Diphasiastrum complanatum]|uniref:Uncharacterized protein n=1 Tax=Diphasiastrum complanatum TaxID=34168 RepID=A0ACC2AVW6_DIPCM|nr:hypothetical protein O6H91_19G059200 [Diphasiastrum complanatum]